MLLCNIEQNAPRRFDKADHFAAERFSVLGIGWFD